MDSRNCLTSTKLSTEAGALWATPTETLLTDLSKAIAQRIVPANVGANLEGVRTLIEQMKADHILQAPALGTGARLGDLLTTLPAPLNQNQQRALAAAATGLRPDDPGLVKSIATMPGLDGDGVAAGVARTLRLGALTGGHVALTKALQVRLQQANETEGALHPLAALRPDEWLDLAYTYGTPDEVNITPVAYADFLDASVERQYPTAALTAHFTDGRRLGQNPALTDVSTFLRNNPAFDIVTANLHAVTDQAKLDNIPNPQQAQLIAGLRSLQRMNTLGARWDETATLLENGLDSPHQILAAGPEQLTTLLDGQVAPERAAALYKKVEELHHVTFAAITAGFSPLSAPRILSTNQFGVPPEDGNPTPSDAGVVATAKLTSEPIPAADDATGSTKLAELAIALSRQNVLLSPNNYKLLSSYAGRTQQVDLTAFINHQPTLQGLFGSQDGCACAHCTSVLGPAAYFVDLLQFVNNALPNAQLLNRLLARRPDLQDLELSCDNTNTEVPAIDLVLEILENAVALPLDVPIRAGTDIESQLNGATVGPDVRKALEQTVQTLVGDVRATREGSDWTVVDGHRRWKVTAQIREGFPAEMANGVTSQLDISGLNSPTLIDAMDQGKKLPNGAEAALAKLFAGNRNRPPDFTEYVVKITPLVTGKSWRVQYPFRALLLLDPKANELTMQTPAGQTWFNAVKDKQTIAAMTKELSAGAVPVLVQQLLAARFLSRPSLFSNKRTRSLGISHQPLAR